MRWNTHGQKFLLWYISNIFYCVSLVKTTLFYKILDGTLSIFKRFSNKLLYTSSICSFRMWTQVKLTNWYWMTCLNWSMAEHPIGNLNVIEFMMFFSEAFLDCCMLTKCFWHLAEQKLDHNVCFSVNDVDNCAQIWKIIS